MQRTDSPRSQILAAAVLAAALSLVPGAASAAEYIVYSEFTDATGGTLQDAVDAAGNRGMVILDRLVKIEEPLILPRFFRLSGMGPQGQGILFYARANDSAIRFVGPETTSAVVIDNLEIAGLWPGDSPGTSIGISMVDIHHVYLDNVTIRGFDVGILGRWSFYIHVRDSNVSLNRTYNYHLLDNANSWRITGGASSQSGVTAIRIETSNNTVIEGVAFESNQLGIYTSTESTHVFNNRFECRPAVPAFCAGAPTGIHVDAGANLTTLIGNYYSGVLPVSDTSGGGLTHRFDHAGGPFLHPVAGAEGLRIELATADDQLVFDADGRLHVGATPLGSAARLNVDAPPGEEALRVGTNSDVDLFVDSTGRVGIATTAPTERLHVDGNLRVDGAIVATGVLCIGSGC
jgi:hypothetical protein